MPARRFGLTFLLVALAMYGCGRAEAPPAAGWVQVGGSAEGFSVRFPRRPAEQSRRVGSAVGAVPFRAWLHQEAERVFSVVYTEYPDVLMGRLSEAQLLDEARDAAVAKSGGRLVSEEGLELAGHPGRAVRIEAAGGQALVQGRLYLVDLRLYQVMATTRPDAGAAAEAGTFLDSFALAPAVSAAP